MTLFFHSKNMGSIPIVDTLLSGCSIVGSISVLGTETPNDVLNIELLNFVEPSEVTVPLEGSTDTPGIYFLKMEYAGALALDPTTTHDGGISLLYLCTRISTRAYTKHSKCIIHQNIPLGNHCRVIF